MEWFGKTSLGELKSKESVTKRVVRREFQTMRAKETAGSVAQSVRQLAMF